MSPFCNRGQFRPAGQGAGATGKANIDIGISGNADSGSLLIGAWQAGFGTAGAQDLSQAIRLSIAIFAPILPSPLPKNAVVHAGPTKRPTAYFRMTSENLF